MCYLHLELTCTWNKVAYGRGGFSLYLKQDEFHLYTSSCILGLYTIKCFNLRIVWSWEKWTLPTAMSILRIDHIADRLVNPQAQCIGLEPNLFERNRVILQVARIILIVQPHKVVDCEWFL